MSRNLSGTWDGAGHAIVIGSSLAGLTAAAVLARHMERVTVIERDRLPSDAQWRPGVAQSRHAHNLMAAGHQGLGTLFPGIQQELLDAQMVSVRVPEDMLMLAPGGWIPRFETGMTMMTGTRDIVDAVVRDRLRAEPKVTFLQEHEVVGLQGGPGDSVSGVRVRAKDKDAKGGWGEPEPMAAEFVVDAAGRKSRAPQWLGELGYDKPAESVVDAKTAYGTTVYEPPVGHAADWKCILLLATPENPRQGILNPIEDGRWMVSVSASGGNRPPTDHEGMLEGAKSLRHPVVYEAIKDATPVGPVYGSGRTENRWRHFEKLRRWPDRFLVIGDALAAFNPSYGQGMSVAVQSALLLDRMLESRGTAGGTQRLRRALSKQVAVAWQLATAIDLHYPWAAEASPPDLPTRLGMRYVDRVGAAAPTDHDAARVVLELAQLLAAPTAVFRPRVLRSAVRGPRGHVSADPPRAPHRAETAPGADDRAISSPSNRKTRSS
ncbi:NAD(P)/FAD-dependent oxidoreductase [Streptomyces sp. CMB-StM0423]|uniref:NAD(P)/FAD-dependent oxidoreductase n=1 Tax=Streptomyces sp. CMB-StM0423 TaxID=2059884 RepID=UPI000C710911|nr:FAD-dependent monooxygenase [Streptomyces sp. CMB-StM0423]AUH43251.1 2-polyprenyl-6-methoxyphenol hydroxylase-like oxidoreductase [Streptomyces sp. CMB-StM0423]